MGEGFFLGFEKQAGIFSKVKDMASKVKDKIILNAGGMVKRPMVSGEWKSDLTKKLSQMYRDGEFKVIKGIFDGTPPKKASFAKRLGKELSKRFGK